ncbi:transporter substrate-binding domain-containing protein [Allopusillimonas ginsengisoli]|uniref:transporter substrate-binding domain-containing protein n=1 Tax=Allopusillimonas ginsengisoli TaxID=453575 RepID=UPI001021B79C|nr:transporter substrate-binding domain-containing protein [Allopusillimonas ginsengisoli]TEA77730.1 transporter substrate-binding domain-containing protein [Allopusillimonas ginsengisoli]
MNLRLLKKALSGVVLMMGLAVAAQAQAEVTVDDIVSRGKLRAGMLVDLPPFGVTTADGKPDGLDADVARLMAKYLGVELEIVPVTGPNRIPYLLTNKVDVLTATFGITPERAKQVMFSIPYSQLEMIVMGPKSLEMNSYEDTAGHTIATPRASTSDIPLTKYAPKTAKILRLDDDATAAQALLSGQAEALGTNQLILAQLAKDNPKLELEKKFTLARQFQGVTLRRGDYDLLQWTNTFIYAIKNSGELDTITQKWLDTPLPELPTF